MKKINIIVEVLTDYKHVNGRIDKLVSFEGMNIVEVEENIDCIGIRKRVISEVLKNKISRNRFTPLTDSKTCYEMIVDDDLRGLNLNDLFADYFENEIQKMLSGNDKYEMADDFYFMICT